MTNNQHDQVRGSDVLARGAWCGTIVCSACRRSEHAHIATKWCCTMNLATKMCQKMTRHSIEATIKSIEHCTAQYEMEPIYI